MSERTLILIGIIAAMLVCLAVVGCQIDAQHQLPLSFNCIQGLGRPTCLK